MCNVIHLVFTCGHFMRQQRSRCLGKKHKSSTSTKAACTGGCSLKVCKWTECGHCQLQRWEQAWGSRLGKARHFLNILGHTSLPGLEEVAKLVIELEDEYTHASWNTRYLSASAEKRPVPEVRTSVHTRDRSLLLQEVHPEDVVEPIQPREWADMDETDFDGDYIASTDPLHPVSTDYSHPWDGEDDSWILQHLDSGAVEEHEAREATIHDQWRRGGEVTDTMPPAIAGRSELETEDDFTSLATFFNYQPGEHEHLSEQRTQATTPLSSIVTNHNGPVREQVEEVIEKFWLIVNSDLPNQPNTSSPTDGEATLVAGLQSASISAANATLPTPQPPPTPSSPPTFPTDNPSITTPPSSTIPTPTPHPPALNQPSTTTTTPLNSTSSTTHSTETRDLNAHRSQDAAEYSRAWLAAARYKIQTELRPYGRRIRHPTLRKERTTGAGK